MRWGVLLAAVLILCVVSTISLFLPYPNARARVTDGMEKTVTRDGRSIAYFVQGDGPPLIFLASAGREASDFNELASTLVAAGYRTISVESPGIGNSSLPDGDLTQYDLADDVAAIMDMELRGIEQAVLIGHAFGNRIARSTATRYGEKVNGVILIAAGGKVAIAPRADRALKGSFNPLNVASQRIADIRYAFFANGNVVPDYWQRGWHIDTARLQSKASALTNSTEWQLAGDEPILIIQGEEDTVAPVADAGQALVDDAQGRTQMVLVRNAGHALLPEQPEQIANSVLGFLAEISPD